jgi:hypothetical protein
MIQSLLKTLYRFLNKLKVELSYDPAIPLLGINLKSINRKMDRENDIEYY